MNNRVRLFIPGIFFVVMLGLLFYGLGRNPNQLPSALVNRPLPEFTRPDLFDVAATVESSKLRGSVFLVNVWATWCPPCHVEHPYLVEISEREPEVVFVGVNYKDDPAAAREFLAERGNPFRYSLIDADGSLGIDLGVSGAPETFLVDASGIIRYRHVGEINMKVWDSVFKPIVEQIR